MSVSMNGLLRGFIYLTIVTSLTAIGIGRLAPRETRFRILKTTGVVPVNGYHFRTYDRLPRLFDPATGALKFVEFECAPGDSFDTAACSPWEDEQGRSDVVGRWLGRTEAGGVCQGCGLARYSLPGGELIERVKLSVMPVSRPCFDPNRPSSVLFAAGDGRLYRHTFGSDTPESSLGADGEVVPTPLAWNQATAGPRPVAINDPIWPPDPKFKGRLIASLTYLQRTPNGSSTMENRLGWLELDREGLQVVRSGRLVDRAPAFARDCPYFDETMPVLAPTSFSSGAGTNLTLAYLTHLEGRSGWILCTTPLELDDATGVPVVKADRVRTVATERSHAAPIFSEDGRTLYAIVNSDPKPESIDSFAVPDLFPQAAVSLAEQDDRGSREATD